MNLGCLCVPARRGACLHEKIICVISSLTYTDGAARMINCAPLIGKHEGAGPVAQQPHLTKCEQHLLLGPLLLALPAAASSSTSPVLIVVTS
jgi:hypothetical protein